MYPAWDSLRYNAFRMDRNHPRKKRRDPDHPYRPGAEDAGCMHNLADLSDTESVINQKNALEYVFIKKEPEVMKKMIYHVGLIVIILALTAGIFYYFWTMKSKNMGENGTLVKNICEEAKRCL